MENGSLGKWDKKDPLLDFFNVDAVPFVLLVDGRRKTNYFGHPSHINIE